MADRKVTALTELTAPVASDVFPVIDVSESANANKNKKIQLTTILKNIPDGTVSSPSVSFVSDTGTTGFFRAGSNDLGVSANQALVASFSSIGLKLGTGTAAAQLHLFSTDTTDQVIIENSDTGADNAPDLVLYRNSASPAADDNLGNLLFRANDAAGNTHDYAAVVAQIEDTTNTSEDGVLDIMTSAAGTLASRIRLKNTNVGINEASPQNILHVTDTQAGVVLEVQCTANDAASGADILLSRIRGASGAGQDNDLLSTIFFEGKNDATTPQEVNYAAIQAKIIDASDETEDGELNLQVEIAGTLTTVASIQTTGINVTGTVTDDGATHDGDVTFTGASANIVFDKSDNALEFADNAELKLGSAGEVRIFHTGSSTSFIVSQHYFNLQANGYFFYNQAGDETLFSLEQNGAVKLYFDNVKKAETSANGLDLPDNSKLQLGTGQDLQVFWDGSSGFVTNQGGGNLHINSNSLLLKNAANTESYIRAYNNGAVELYHDNAKKAETTSSGLTVTGTVTETSDIAFKSDIEPITNTLDKLQQITGYKYKLDNASIDSMGVIAQDVEKVFPELVHGDEGSKTLQYSGLIGVLVEAVKDLSAKVKALESN